MTNIMNIEEYIRSYREILEPYIDDYLAALAARQATRSGQEVADLYEVFREAREGGKCIRGSLVKLGYEIATGRPADHSLLPASAAFEIFQTAVLCHDDIIDKSPLRRGKESIWQAIVNRSTLHYGISQAISIGDAGFFLANRLIAGSSFGAEAKVEAMKVFLDVQLSTLDGQMLDVYLSQRRDYSDETGILNVASLKTAWYTVVGPLQLGAVLGRASPEPLDAMRRYGLSLGIAFQLRDDILGIEAEAMKTGKSNTSDIAEGKATLLIHHAMKQATPDQLTALRRLYGRENISERDRVAVRDIFDATGAFAEVARRAEAYLTEAGNAVEDITKDAEHVRLLSQLGNMMFQRKI
ncbi:MAG: polyprenyl synthetase family protein [Synergistaceae bacterium]|jgi:geranylgeranyl pyrophosphate synthase|nr:polyprenyl synthetase family protein [Synergistaceae bacterium]